MYYDTLTKKKKTPLGVITHQPMIDESNHASKL